MMRKNRMKTVYKMIFLDSLPIESGESVKKAMKARGYPSGAKHTGWWGSDMAEVEVPVSFTSETLDGAKKKAEDIASSWGIDVFTVFKDKKKLFTEEDL